MKRTVFVTGATRGIGRELVKQLSALDFAVFATGRDETLLESLKTETGCRGEAADLSDSDEAVGIYHRAKSTLGRVDALINNAGRTIAKRQ